MVSFPLFVGDLVPPVQKHLQDFRLIERCNGHGAELSFGCGQHPSILFFGGFLAVLKLRRECVVANQRIERSVVPIADQLFSGSKRRDKFWGARFTLQSYSCGSMVVVKLDSAISEPLIDAVHTLKMNPHWTT